MTTSTPTPTSTTHRFPVYPLLLNDGSGNVDTTSLAAGSPEAASNMWRDFIASNMWRDFLSSTAHEDARATTPQKHIRGLLSGLTISEEEGAFDVSSVATAIHLASQLIQLSEQVAAAPGLAPATAKQLPAEKMAAAERLVTQGCTISAHHLAQFEKINNFKLCFDKPYSDVPQPIGWFVLDQDSYAIDFEFNNAFYESPKHPNIVHYWATPLPRELPCATPLVRELRINMYAGYSGSEGEGEDSNESGKFNFIGLEHLFPVNFNASRDSNTANANANANANAKAKVEHLLIFRFMGASRQVSNWHFEQASRAIKPHAPCSLQLYFGNTRIRHNSNRYKSNDIAPEVNNCSFLKTDGRPPWFTEVAVLEATLANRVTWNPTVYNNCLFNGVTLIGHAPKASLIFNECGFTSTSVDIRNKLNTAPPTLGIALSDCFGTNRVPNSLQDSIYFKVDPGQAVDVFGTDRAPAENKANPVKDSRTDTRYITLDFVVGANHISDTPYGAAPAKITLMDRPDKYNPVSVNILGPAEVFMSNIAVSAIKCCPHRENHFVGINVVEPPRGTIFTDWASLGVVTPQKTSVALSYSQGGTDIGVESLPAVLFDVLHIPAIDVDTEENIAQFDLRYAEKWGKAGAWERARTIGLLRANATEENIAQIERVIERLAPTGTRDSAKLVPTPSIGTKYRVKL